MKELPVETLGGDVKVIHVKNNEELQCNVEYVEIEQSDMLDGGIVALTADGTKWIPFEVNLTSDIVDNEVVIEFAENQEEIIETTHEEEPLENLQATQVLIIEDGSFAYIQGSENEVSLSNTGESPEVTIKTDPLFDEKADKNKAKVYACKEPGCNRSFSRRHHLKVHNRYHTGLRPYECTAEGCNKSFSTFHSRKAHLRTHTGEAPYACTYDSCTKRFKTSGDLQKHIRVHTGERPFACPFVGCNKYFTTSNIRKVHIRTHTGEKPYECTHEGCNKRFASSTNFKNHKRIHAGIKPFCCKVPNCLKRFTEYSSLYKHQLVHSQHKKHQCNICQKTYRQTSTLTTHKRTAHGVISAEDGTEIVIEDMIGLGGMRSKNFKEITSKLLKLKKDCNIVTISEDGSPLYIVSSTDVESVNVNDLVQQAEIV